MKKLFVAVAIIYLVSGCMGVAYAMQTSIYINGEHLDLPLEPRVESGTTLVPMRPIFEALGAKVTWNSIYKEVEAEKGDINIKLPIGKKIAIKNGYMKELQVAAKIVDGNTLVPLRFVSESLEAKVDWNEDSQIITINTIDNEKDKESDASQASLSMTDLAKQAEYVVMVMTFDENENLTATASGVVIGSDGLVVTNYHVIAGASSVQIINDLEESFEVKGVLALDKERDLAILQVEADLPYVELGDSEAVEIGDQVISIGSPLGIKNTVSNGVVSNFLEIDNQSFIQTTAPISEGSSGGALFNNQGQLIGITTAVISTGQNLNLVIPINDLKLLTDNLAEAPMAFESLFLSHYFSHELITSVDSLVVFLTENHSEYENGNSSIRFTYLASENNLFDFEIDALINPLDYGTWLEIDNKDKLAIIGSILKDIDAHVDLSKSFRVVFFYQDRWPFYPSSFEEKEISLAPDGEIWLVTHIIARGYTVGDELKWEIFY